VKPQAGGAATTSPTPGTGTPVSPTSAAPEPGWSAIDDPRGDTIVDGTTERRPNNRVDIVRSQATNQPRGIVLTAQPAEPADPTKDPNWTSDSSFVAWQLDTTGDGRPDFEVQFFVVDGSAAGFMTRVGDTSDEAFCDIEAGWVSNNYAVGFDPACVGSPATFSYRVTINYDSDPKNPDGDVLTDTAPDGGMSRPVARSG
jgi:hypothetical protein